MTRDEILALARQAGLQRSNPGQAIEVLLFAQLLEKRIRAELKTRAKEPLPFIALMRKGNAP